MVGSNKILTVSYGTFSCTLEGFEDSFGTMKAIAEYFRDLAADDRYFGAVPPVPDAEMLARIAEREVARRVEARMDASGIVLRVGQALDNSATPDITPAAPVPVQRVSTATHAAFAPVMPPAPVAPRQPEPVAEIVVPTAPAHPDADSVAAKLQRIRDVVGKNNAGLAAATNAEDEDMPTLAMSQPSDTFADLDAITEPVAEPVADAIAAVMPQDDVAAILAEVAADAGIADTQDEAASQDTAPDASEAPELVVEEMPAAPVMEEAVTAPTPIRARVIKMRRADFDRAVAMGMLVDDAHSAPETTADAPAADAEPAAGLMAKDFADTEVSSLADEEDLETAADLDDLARLDGDFAPQTAATTLSPDEEADLLAELEAVEREAEPADDMFMDDPMAADDADLVAQEAEIADAAAKDTPDSDLTLMNIMARVAETAADQPAETADEPVAAMMDNLDADAAVGQEPDLAGETMPGLADTIRAVAIDAAAPAALDVAENLFADDADTAEPEQPFDLAAIQSDAVAATDDLAEAESAIPHSHLRTEPEADEAALSRIMSEADAQLSEPEASRRREAIAQLRAAVAATEAARRLGEPPVEADTSAEDAFRDDLQQVVRPRRPMTPTAEVRSERPRPAPLKLVASQRVDVPQQAPRNVTAPIRPRRVTLTAEEEVMATPTASPVALASSAADAAARSQASSFAEFAAEMGATGLSDLLEAAAAYTAFVEGSEDFSRPQLLKKVTQMVPEQFSREDGLRSFGTLLREGRITRTRAGRFQVSGETRFNPERRAG